MIDRDCRLSGWSKFTTKTSVSGPIDNWCQPRVPNIHFVVCKTVLTSSLARKFTGQRKQTSIKCFFCLIQRMCLHIWSTKPHSQISGARHFLLIIHFFFQTLNKVEILIAVAKLSLCFFLHFYGVNNGVDTREQGEARNT